MTTEVVAVRYGYYSRGKFHLAALAPAVGRIRHSAEYNALCGRKPEGRAVMTLDLGMTSMIDVCSYCRRKAAEQIPGEDTA